MDPLPLYQRVIQDDAGKKIEYVYMEPTLGRPWSVIVYLHGHQEGERPGGKIFADWGVLQKMANRGVLAVALSLPGYGASEGPADFAGPRSQAALRLVIAELRARSDVQGDKIALVGISRGAVVAANVAAQDAGLAGAVLISGAYNFKKLIPQWQASKDAGSHALVSDFKSEAGFHDRAITDRSVVLHKGKIQIPLLTLNGGKDILTDGSSARKLVKKIRERGLSARAVIFPELGHQIPSESLDADVDGFLRGILKK
jgi:pimeloyl-ACP methyl ester carboxylesterase